MSISKDNKLSTRLMSKIFALMYDLWIIIGDIYLIHLRKKHLENKNEYNGHLSCSESPSRIAVVAIFPSDESVVFTKNLLNAFVKNGFYVLVLSTRTLSTAQREHILASSHKLIERHNIGQDLGSYKHGLHWLENNRNKLENVDTIALANDSMYYPQNMSHVISAMIDCPEPWQCLFENYQTYHHAQSFFLMFKKEVLPDLISFWKKYTPHRLRMYAIQQGEIALSRKLKKKFYCRAYYNSLFITDTLHNMIAHNIQLSELVINSYGGGLPLESISTYKRELILKKAINRISIMMHHANPTHTVGLIISNGLNAPLKRDCCYRGFFDIVAVLKSVTGFNNVELAAMEKDLRKKGTGSGVSGWRRLLYLRGRI